MSDQDIRWKQRYKHFKQAFSQLEKAVHLALQRPLSELEEQGLIQSFEYTHELAWNVLKDFLEDQGLKNLYASKDSTREAFKRGLIQNGEVWMDMIQSRNLTSHTYNQKIAREIAEKIIENYVPEFSRLIELMEMRSSGRQP
jgi:nucleotidyltransferase substrate binding protein (TIGR01987 family)